jgi:tRNA-Thr(GGU) m(6)t(6)A37 methyltransferase TsaA
MQEYSLKPVGYISNNIENRKEMVALGVESSIIINDEYIQCLEHLDENSHLIIMCFFHRAKRDVLKVYPRKFGLSGSYEKGVMATRSPDRPNPVSITVAKLLKIQENIVYVNKLDAVNGTPVIDIKPYSYGTDCVYNTFSLNKKIDFSKASDERLYEYFAGGLKNFVFNIDDSFDTGINYLIQFVRKTGYLPDRENVQSIETNLTGNALDALYYYGKFTPGDEKISQVNTHTCDTFIKIILLSGETFELSLKQNINV